MQKAPSPLHDREDVARRHFFDKIGSALFKFNFPIKNVRGFTIIELLVVVAIIAVLTGIVLVNVTSYINKGRDAAAKGNLATMLTNGAVFYDGNSTFTGFSTNASGTISNNLGGTCTGNAGFVGPCQALVGPVGTNNSGPNYAFTIDCSVSGVAGACSAAGITAWCGQISLKGTGTPTFCVDSTGNKKLGGVCAAATGICS